MMATERRLRRLTAHVAAQLLPRAHPLPPLRPLPCASSGSDSDDEEIEEEVDEEAEMEALANAALGITPDEAEADDEEEEPGEERRPAPTPQKYRLGDAFDEAPSEASLIAELTGDQKAIQQATSRLWELWYNEEGEAARRRLDEAGGMMGSPRTASRAAESLQTLADEFPSWAEPVNRLATLRFMERKFEESIELCERVLELKPHHFACLSGLTMAYYNNRQARPHPTPP